MKLLLLLLAFICVSVSCGFSLKKNPDQQCGENEMWNTCGGCESTCGDRERPCFNFCGRARCQCGYHYARNEKSGKCVLWTDCPKE